jgi:hypothetical protein
MFDAAWATAEKMLHHHMVLPLDLWVNKSGYGN